ncbi:MAG: hypothetical protein A2Y38_04920 [Spirochaetes bacterium GWB1_59_5]|nr:MAG: hypothetical protein A2Y38_04920 [Spirochaetes bacterium GWB1_59_5]
MKMGGIIAYASALSAIAATATIALGTSAILPISLSLIAAAFAVGAGLWSSRATQKNLPTGYEDKQIQAVPAASATAIIVESAPLVAEPAIDESTALATTTIALALLELQYADALLGKVPEETEAAVFALMDRLIALRDQSGKASKSAATAHGDAATSSTINALADNAKATIARVRVALSDMRKHDKNAAAGLQALGKELTSGMELLAEIGEITERSRLIAFNMAIEAARIGSQGNGFKVIVNELRNLNDQTAVFSKRVSELLGRFKKFNESLVEKSVKDSAVVAEEVERGIQDEEKAIESLLTISNASVALSRDIEQVVATMNRDLDGVLESLQFQDITRQMVEGVQFMVSEVRGKMMTIAQPADGAPLARPDQSHIKELRTRLLALAHTKGEKETIQEVIV